MPNYQAYLRSVAGIDADLAQLFGKLYLIEVAPGDNPDDPDSDAAYFMPYLPKTQIGVATAAEYGFDGSADLVVCIRTTGQFNQTNLVIPQGDVIVEPWFPEHFLKIGSDIILDRFHIDPHDLVPPYTGPFPPVLHMTVKKNACYPRGQSSSNWPVPATP